MKNPREPGLNRGPSTGTPPQQPTQGERENGDPESTGTDQQQQDLDQDRIWSYRAGTPQGEEGTEVALHQAPTKVLNPGGREAALGYQLTAVLETGVRDGYPSS